MFNLALEDPAENVHIISVRDLNFCNLKVCGGK